MSKRLNLSEFNMYEKFGWVVDSLGDYDSVDKLLIATGDAGNLLERIVKDAEHEGEEKCESSDLLHWYLEGYSPLEALEHLSEHSSGLESVVDKLVVEHEIDVVSTYDGFESYSAFSAWRNS